MSERITEDRVREHFKRDPLFDAVKLEEQSSTIQRVKRRLSKASKHGTGRSGYPEFIITIPALPNDIIVIECKANPTFHESGNRDNPVDYAVDGVLHYMSFLSSEFNVIGIAVSGTDNVPLISSFYQKLGENTYTVEDNRLLDIFSYIAKFKDECIAENLESGEITKLAIELNNELNDYSIVEYERCTLISAILLALQNEAFRESYQSHARTETLQPKPARLASFIISAIKQVLEDSLMDDTRISTMISEYQTIQNKTLAKEARIKKKKASSYENNFVIRDITQRLESKILPLIRMGDKGYDVLGRFYTEFIRYSGTDKKTGLVLTPKHITEFFCDIVNLSENDVVFDSCCGTGGFLVSAMKRMLEQAGNHETKKTHIKQNQIMGIEKRTDMFTFACSNMMMSGDGKSHIYQGDSFSAELKDKVQSFNPTVAFLNPPYDVGEDGQLGFIENALSCLSHGGRCVAIVQMSCATSQKALVVRLRKRILAEHTLLSVFSMPNELFHPVGVVTCVMVFKAKSPHPNSFKSCFGYFKQDGFIKKKNLGRIDGGAWSQIRKNWLDIIVNRESVAGVSVTHHVDGESEWCAEAYIHTDYGALSSKNFEDSIKQLVSHYFNMGFLDEIKRDKLNSQGGVKELSPSTWREFGLESLFAIAGSKSHTKSQIEEHGGGQHPYVVTSSENNGVLGLYNHYTEKGNVLTIDSATVGSCFYQAFNFSASDHVEKLIPKFTMNVFSALFIKTILDLEKFRYGFGRKFAQMRIKKTTIRLPSTVNDTPDFSFMENYIQSLPYSSNLTQEIK